jgi:hypothetical protein
MRKTRKLVLHRESIRRLDLLEKGQVVGGGSYLSDCARCIISDIESCIPECDQTWSGCGTGCC